ncbi:ABC transporter permease [Bdellovibrio sp.]|uniref:ABC transporter permease n=1 Tax=Bdellovibrio sp. TaxID=28201 RepID=UPI0039E70C7A
MFFLSWRQLMSRKKQTMLILLGISFGTLLFVSISGIQLGMRQYISEQLLNNTAHILITGAEQDILAKDVTEALYGPEGKVFWRVPPGGKRDEARLQNYQGWYQRLSDDAEVFDFSPRLNTNALLTNGKFSVSVGLLGTIPERHTRLTNVEKYLKEGSFSALRGGGNNLVVGSGVASKLGARLNQVINVGVGIGASRPYKIVGIVHFGNKQLDESISYAHLKNVQTLTKSPGRITEIAVALLDIDKSSEIADFWQMISSDKVEDWQEANKAFMEMIQVQDFSRYFITTAILIVAAFGIYNVLTIMINQKRREIAILRAIGYSPKRILELILYQGFMLGIAGGLLGLVLGFLMCVWVGSIDFGFEIGGSNHLLMSYDWSIYVTAFVTANIASFIASYIPAWEASRLTPIDIIRSES